MHGYVILFDSIMWENQIHREGKLNNSLQLLSQERNGSCYLKILRFKICKIKHILGDWLKITVNPLANTQNYTKIVNMVKFMHCFYASSNHKINKTLFYWETTNQWFAVNSSNKVNAKPQ